MIKVIFKRGSQLESEHEVKTVVLNSKNNVVFSTKNDNDITFPRSAIKIFQALPMIQNGSYKFYNLNSKQIALSASSHFGEPKHIFLLYKWLKKLRIDENILKCGIHNPLNLKSSNDLLYSKIRPTQIYNNCSGKHLGMITSSIYKGFNVKNYTNFNHPLQKDILKILEYFNEYKIKDKFKAIDGCSAPQYSFPLKNLALSMQKISNFNLLEPLLSFSLKKIIDSISQNPFYIGGTGRLDSQIIKITKGRIFCKIGAEGIFMFSDFKKNYGGIIKIKDGNQRALPIVVIKLLKKIKSINKNEYELLSILQKNIIYNHKNIKVGIIECKFL
ncbi:MAG: hypothetical protein CFH22_00696 [Alphaproteobacteria bacterium MarineAlpha5_Bin12]|nr:MAG: hypothetical protein CFH22_00696 [Alphaproteobacteria bacterium MarineAlpha5_Bin12]|tara:strand:- start:414 stop:1403 length:990 start_codon:yes stop_codon:yes gene_type:complete